MVNVGRVNLVNVVTGAGSPVDSSNHTKAPAPNETLRSGPLEPPRCVRARPAWARCERARSEWARCEWTRCEWARCEWARCEWARCGWARCELGEVWYNPLDSCTTIQPSRIAQPNPTTSKKLEHDPDDPRRPKTKIAPLGAKSSSGAPIALQVHLATSTYPRVHSWPRVLTNECT